MRWLALALVVAAGAVWVFGPRASLDRVPWFEADRIGEDVDAYLAEREAAFDDIVEGTEARVRWAGAPGEATDWAIVYAHGFSASSEEIRPVPGIVADRLGANVFYMRFAGHGRDSAAMGAPESEDWMLDMAEALAIGRRIGRRTAVISTSTGGTAATIAAADPDLGPMIDAMVMISPNFGPQNAFAGLLVWPFAETWVPILAGETRGFDPVNEDHARYWTETYPTVAAMPMQALVEAVVGTDLSLALAPTLVFISPDDQVVNPMATRAAMAMWGGPVDFREVLSRGPGIDPQLHVLAGDILSPALTEEMAAEIAGFLEAL